ncbi:nascent polypeptide-associated complex subunit alpha, muscle-specific form-like [Elephas maximus indicus]|uniref:nascent polypeptide-associated complex subunit alpha, muscle-specific form-like n=1 Tax=Elephas maximus indicus TaxID=99487 RepID=UPI0021169C09|nr:nascent polypeptide-associated complex subunit alpha, muscle-specific form-like [Elephas maximus indicus]
MGVSCEACCTVLGLHNSPLFFHSLSFFIPFCFSPPAVHPVSSSLSVTAALEQPRPTLPPPDSLAPHQFPLATTNQPSLFPSPSNVASTPIEAPFPQSSSGIAVPLGASPFPSGTPAFLPDLIGPPISPAALALASPMIAPALKGAHSSSAPLALVALAPPAVQKSSPLPPNPLISPPVAVVESVSVTSLSTPIAPSSPKTASVRVPSQVVPNPKSTSSPPGIVNASSSHLVSPVASHQSGLASCPEIPPITPLAITSPPVKGIPIPSALTSPQNLVTLKESIGPPAALSLSTQSVPVATSQKAVAPSDPVFLTSLGSPLAPLHQSSFGSSVQLSGQTDQNTLSNPTILDSIPVGCSSMGVSYPSERSVMPPLHSMNEVVPAAGTPTSPLPLSVDKGPSGSLLSPTASRILQGSPDAAYHQPLVAQFPVASPGSPGLKEAPVSSVGVTPLVMTNPSTISVVSTAFEVTTCMSPPISSGSMSSKDPVSYTASVMGPVTPEELPTSQVKTALGIPVSHSFPLPAPEDPKSLPPSALEKLPTQKDFQTVLTSPIEAPISPAHAGVPTKKDSTPLALSVSTDSPPQSTSSSLEMSLSSEATLAKKSLVEPLPVVKPDSAAASPLGVLHSPTSVIKTNPCGSPDPTSLLLKSSPTVPTVAPTGISNKKNPATPAGVALVTVKGTSTPTTTACPFLEGAVSVVPKGHLAKNGTSTLTTLPLVPSASESCPVTPALTSSPQNVSAFPATLALAPDVTKSVPFPSLPPAGTPPDAKEVDGISHTPALAPAVFSPEVSPNEKDSGVSVTTSSKGTLTYLTDSPSLLSTSVSPQTKRPPSKKGSATSPATLTLAPSVPKNEIVIPGSPVGNLSSPGSPLEASLPPDASLSFQGPNGSPPRKHSPTPSTKGTSTSPPVTPSSSREAPAIPSPKDAHNSPGMTPPSAKGSPGTPSPKKSPTLSPVTPPSPKEAPIPPPVTLPSSKRAPVAPSSKGDPATLSIMTPSKGAPAAPSTIGAPIPPPVTTTPSKGGPATPSPKDALTPLPVTHPSKEAPNPSPVTPPSSKGVPAAPSTKGTPTPLPVTPPSSRGVPAAPSAKGVPTPSPVIPSKGANTPPPMTTPRKGPPAAAPSINGAPTTPSTEGVPAPPPVIPPSSKEAPAGPSTKGTPTAPPVTPPPSRGAPETQSTKDIPTSPAMTPPSKETPATASPKSSPTSPALVICPSEATTPQASKGLPTKKGPTVLKEVHVAPSPESASVIMAPTQKGPSAKKASTPSPLVCPDPSAKHGTKGPLHTVAPAPLLTVSTQKGSSPKTSKTLPISPAKGKDSVHASKIPLAPPPESKTSATLGTAASEKVLPKTGPASLSAAPTPSVSLPVAPSPVLPLLPKQQFLPSSPGLVLESPCKPPAPADEDELPPLIPPEPISGGVPFQPVLVNMPIPKSAGIPAPTPSAKQPILKNNKGIGLGLLCAWCVAHTPLRGYPPILTLGCAAFSSVYT